MSSHILLSLPMPKLKDESTLDKDFDEILKSCGIRSRSNSDNIVLPASDSFMRENKDNKNDKKKEIECELYCAESENFPNIPFGKTPPDTSRIKEFYMQYLSKVQLKDEK
jgi:hypothetical protein